MEFLFHDGNKQVGADCDPYLRFDRIHGGAVECLDPQMLLYPFEKKFDLPAGFVQLANSNRCRSFSFVNDRKKTGYNKNILI